MATTPASSVNTVVAQNTLSSSTNLVPLQAQASAGSAVLAVKVVIPKTDSNGKISFTLGVSAQDIALIEVVDIDLLIVTVKGERFLLTEAALYATTADNPIINLSSGEVTDAANLFKKAGLLKPVVGGSFRLEASEIKPTNPENSNGQAIGPGAEDEFKIKNIMEQLSELQIKIAQSQVAAKVSEVMAEEVPSFRSNFVATEQNTSIVTSSSLSTKTKTKDEDKTQSYTEVNVDLAAFPEISSPVEKGNVSGKVQGVQIWDGKQVTGKSFGDTDVRFMLSDQRLKVLVNADAVAVSAPSSADSTKAYSSLVFGGQSNLASIVLHFDKSQNQVNPPGFKINDQDVTQGDITFNADGLNGAVCALEWTVAEDGATVATVPLVVTVKYLDANGNAISKFLDVKFSYGVVNSSNFYQLDGNGHPIIQLPSNGFSYDFTGRDGANENINAGNGDDKINGGTGNDTLSGGRGNDEILGNAGNDTLLGEGGNDLLSGGDGNDNLDAGSGDDLLIGGAGGDLINGGISGNDTASYAGSLEGVEVHLTRGNLAFNKGGDALGDALSNIKNLIGSDHNDKLVGDEKDNTLSGGLGDDVLEGGVGFDALVGGVGNDTASYEHAGTSGLTASLENSLLNTGEAAGDIYSSVENLSGSEGSDLLIGDVYANTLYGNDGNDDLIGNAGDDNLFGDDGDDFLIGGVGGDALSGGDGSDTASYKYASKNLTNVGGYSGVVASLTTPQDNTGEAYGDSYKSVENLVGSDFSDRLVGNADANTLEGGAGDDVLIGGVSADLLAGGDGIDTASYETATSNVIASLLDSTHTLNTGDAQGDSYTGIENLTGSDYADILIGNGSSNLLTGGKGNDLLKGGGGGDTFSGGDGSDTVSYEDNQSSGINVYISTDKQSFNSGAAVGDTYSKIENIIGTQFDDSMTGDAFSNNLKGLLGNDTLDGGVGSAGDVLDGGDGTDAVTYANASDAVNLSLAAGGSFGDAAGDNYISVENVIGSKFDDSIEGDSGSNVLLGAGGNDILKGGGGSDILFGGDGDDNLSNSFTKAAVQTYNGGDGLSDTGFDTVTYAGFDKVVYADLVSGGRVTDADGGVSEQIYLGIENVFGGKLADTLIGNSKSNSLFGGEGDDTLKGGGGIDLLFGDVGDDSLQGGSGSDALNGGDGFDTASYSDASSGITIDLTITVAGVGNGAGTGDAAGDSFNSIEGVVGSNYADTFIASMNATRFNGGTQKLINTGETSFGGDTVDYGADMYGIILNLENVPSTGVVVDSTQVNSLIRGDTFENIDNIVGSTSSGNQIIGNAKDNIFTGGTQADTLEGGAGNDVLLGGSTAKDASGNYKFASGNDLLNGGSGDDKLYGLDGNDTLIGGDGSDVLDGGAGTNTASYSYLINFTTVTVDLSNLSAQLVAGTTDRDTLINIQNVIGGAGNDSLTGSDIANELDGGNGNDTLWGKGGNDTLLGGDGDDILVGGAGRDILEGGLGTNTASYADANSGVTVYLDIAKSDANTGDAEGDTFVNIQNLIGSNYNDVLSGYGDATVTSTLNGGLGDDTFISDGSANIYVGGDGIDTVTYRNVETAGLTIDLNDGSQSTGHAVGDTFTTIEKIIGSAGNDIFYAGASALALSGGGGGDGVSYRYAQAVTGTTGVTVSLAGQLTQTGYAVGDTFTDIDNLTGSDFNDTLQGNGRSNIIDGGAGNDTFVAALGNPSGSGFLGDTYIGGAGTNLLSYAELDSKYRIEYSMDDSGKGAVQILDETNTVVQTDHFSAIQNFQGNGGDTAGANVLDEGTDAGAAVGSVLSGNSSANNLSGTAKADVIYGLVGDDELHGLGGNDKLYGGSGSDILFGGSGNDTLYGDVTRDGTVVTGSSAGNDILMGGSGQDTLYGGDGNDVLYGYGNASYVANYTTNSTIAATDILDGGMGNDHLFGGAGATVLRGGDELYSGAGGAYATYVGNNTSSTIALANAATGTLAGAVGNFARYDDIVGPGTIDFSVDINGGTGSGSGQAFGDQFDANMTGAIGFQGDTVFYGRADAGTQGEVLIGNGGNDTFYGSAGCDVLDGRTGNDVVDYSSATSVTNLVVNLTTNVNIGGDALGDKLFNIEVVKGGAGNDTLTAALGGSTLYGNSGNDSLTGSSGSDTLYGGDGNDALLGGHGNDFLYAGNHATYAGFTTDSLDGGAGNDTLDIRTPSTGTNIGNLSGVVATGGEGNDTFIMNQSDWASGATGFSVNGDTGTDTLQFYASGDGALSLASLGTTAFTSIEVLDLSKDNFASTLSITVAGIQGLVDATNAKSAQLIVKLGNGEQFSVDSTDSASQFSATGVTTINGVSYYSLTFYDTKLHIGNADFVQAQLLY